MEHTQRALHNKHGKKWQTSSTASKVNALGYLVHITPNEVAYTNPQAVKVMVFL